MESGVNTHRMERKHESKSISKENLSELQNRKTPWRGASNLQRRATS